MRPEGEPHSWRAQLSRLAGDVGSSGSHVDVRVVVEDLEARVHGADGGRGKGRAIADANRRGHGVVGQGSAADVDGPGKEQRGRNRTAAGPGEIIAAMGNYQSQTTSNPTSFVQKAGIEALRGPQEAVGLMVQEFEQRRNYVVERLNAIEGLSCFRAMGEFYAFPNVSGTYGKRAPAGEITAPLSFAEQLLQTAGVAVVPGAVFGDDRCIRLSFATSMEQLHAGLDRLEQFAKGLQA